MNRIFLAAVTVLVACQPLETRVEPRAATVDELVAHVRVCAREERWSALYDCLSTRAQDECSRFKFVIGFPTQTVPAPHGYRVRDVVAYGDYDGALEDPANPARAIVFYSYVEPGKPRFDVQILCVKEGGAWHVDGPK